MDQGSPYNRRVMVIFSIILASMIIISSQFPVSFAGNCKDDDGDLFCDPPDCNDDDKEVYPGEGCPYVPIEEINTVVKEIEELAKAGTITSGQADSLLSKLQNAVNKIEVEKINVAINILTAMINQINAYINSGVLSPEAGKNLIDGVNAIINSL